MESHPQAEVSENLSHQIEANAQSSRRVGIGLPQKLSSRTCPLCHGCPGASCKTESERMAPDFLLYGEAEGRAVNSQLVAIRECRNNLRDQGDGRPDVQGTTHTQRKCVDARPVGNGTREEGAGRKQFAVTQRHSRNHVKLRSAANAS